MIDNVTQFNNLRLEYNLNGTQYPSSAASLATAQSALKQLPSSTLPAIANSGVYLARLIAKQALSVLNNKEIIEIKRGNHKNHPSLLDNTELRKSLFSWAASQVPGHVSFIPS